MHVKCVRAEGKSHTDKKNHINPFHIFEHYKGW